MNPQNQKSLNLERSSSEHERNFQKIKSRKTEIEIESDSNYDSKLKSKAI